MAVPDFQSVMRPLLEELADGQEHTVRDVTHRLADRFQLSDAERDERLDGGQSVFSNRVAWAKTHLKKAGLIENPKRGRIWIAERGRQALANQAQRIDMRYLCRYPEYLVFTGKAKTSQGKTIEDVQEPSERTPQEVLEAAYEELRVALADELVEKLRSCSPYFFEKVVVQLLLAMGYGGAGGQGIVTPRTGDKGIDGVIYEDRLGLDVVCIQAKRWEGSVGREKVQAFVGSMDYYRARKGVIITTSHFTSEAKEYVDRIEGKKVVLIDGERLAQLMIDHEVGVSRGKRYQLFDVSQDFFDEEEEG